MGLERYRKKWEKELKISFHFSQDLSLATATSQDNFIAALFNFYNLHRVKEKKIYYYLNAVKKITIQEIQKVKCAGCDGAFKTIENLWLKNYFQKSSSRDCNS